MWAALVCGLATPDKGWTYMDMDMVHSCRRHQLNCSSNAGSPALYLDVEGQAGRAGRDALSANIAARCDLYKVSAAPRWRAL